MDSTVNILLHNGMVAVVDGADYADLSKFKWFAVVRGGAHKTTYAIRNVYEKGRPRTQQYMHRRVLEVSSGCYTDHIDGNGLNNTRSNLRIVSQSVNVQKGSKWGSRIYRGVHKVRGRWVASMYRMGEYIHLGTHDTAAAAATAYNNASKLYFGEFGYINEV